jgi:hypothetical protein
MLRQILRRPQLHQLTTELTPRVELPVSRSACRRMQGGNGTAAIAILVALVLDTPGLAPLQHHLSVLAIDKTQAAKVYFRVSNTTTTDNCVCYNFKWRLVYAKVLMMLHASPVYPL